MSASIGLYCNHPPKKLPKSKKTPRNAQYTKLLPISGRLTVKWHDMYFLDRFDRKDIQQTIHITWWTDVTNMACRRSHTTLRLHVIVPQGEKFILNYHWKAMDCERDQGSFKVISEKPIFKLFCHFRFSPLNTNVFQNKIYPSDSYTTDCPV